MRILSGIQPSGTLHLGNYFGMMQPAIELQDRGEAFYFIADYHALTTLKDPAVLRQNVREVAIDFLAAGLDPKKCCFFRQSDIRAVAELSWILATVAPMGLLERCHSYKDKIAKGLSASVGLFSYPILMAADILLYDANVVPVGKDQLQHLEITRDIAEKFNNKYGDVFVIPQAKIDESVMLVPGIDGQKMSKSLNNFINIFLPEKELKKVILSIVTDATPLEAPKNPDTCNVFKIYKLLASEQQTTEMQQNYLRGGYGYGHAKNALYELILEKFRTQRNTYLHYMNNRNELDDKLKIGADKARVIAKTTLNKVREHLGFKKLK